MGGGGSACLGWSSVSTRAGSTPARGARRLHEAGGAWPSLGRWRNLAWSGQFYPSTGVRLGQDFGVHSLSGTPGALWGHAPLIRVQLVLSRVSALVGAYDL